MLILQINEALKKQLDTLEHVIFANLSHKPAIKLCQELIKNSAQKDYVNSILVIMVLPL